MIRTATAVAISAAMALFTGEAFAVGNADATAVLSNFSIQLIDLAPDDGIPPTITFVPGNSAGSAIAGSQLVENTFPDPFAENSESVANGSGSASASLAGDPLGGSATITTAATALGDPHMAFSQAEGDVEFGELSFTLSPHTEVEMNATLTLDADVTQAVIGLAVAEGGYDFFGPAGDPEFFISIEAEDFPGYEHVDDTQSLFATYTNDTDAAMDVGFDGGVQSYANVNEVPEPATWLLLMAGLLAGLARPRARALARD